VQKPGIEKAGHPRAAGQVDEVGFYASRLMIFWFGTAPARQGTGAD